MERHAWIVVLVLLLIYVPAVLDASRGKPLWHDELYTWYTSQAPTFGDMWHDLRRYDLNPPLIFVLTRLSFRCFGVSTLAARLPEMVAFLVALLCVFRFTRRRMGVVFGFFSVMVIVESDIFQLAVEARPYALMFASFGVALVAWQSLEPGAQGTAERGWKRGMWLAVMGIAVACLLLSHIFGVVALAALVGGEVLRAITARKVRWSVLAALVLPLAVMGVYVPMLQNHASAIYPAAFAPDGDAIFAFYIHLVDRVLIALCLTAMAVLASLGIERLRSPGPAVPERWFFTRPEWAVTIFLLAIPLLLMGCLLATGGAFFPRYGSMATFGVATLAAALLGRWTLADARPDPRAALIGSGILLLMSGVFTVIPKQIADGTLLPTFANSEPRLPPCDACARARAIDPALPLVAASGLTFIEMNHHEPAATVDHLFYLTDPVASLQFAHANIFERMPEVIDRFHLRGQSEPYAEFVREHPHFFVFGRYDYPEDWLLRKLTADGAHIRVVARTSDEYRDTELYEVWRPGVRH